MVQIPSGTITSDLGWLEDNASLFSRFDNEYMLARFTSSGHAVSTLPPRHIEDFTLILCMNGVISMEVDSESWTLEAGNLLILGGHHTLGYAEATGDADAFLMVLSRKFLDNVSLDLNLLDNIRLNPTHRPIIKLEENEMRLLGQYFGLVYQNTVTNTAGLFARGIARSLVAAMIYQLLQFGISHNMAETSGPSTRRDKYVREFFKLLQSDYRKERTLNYYADKLCITPKYLSALVKESTGTAATAWIDRRVIMDAKNLLRFSGLTIQQVAYELGFSSQASFGKYFKHATGQTPTQFKRS